MESFYDKYTRTNRHLLKALSIVAIDTRIWFMRSRKRIMPRCSEISCESGLIIAFLLVSSEGASE